MSAAHTRLLATPRSLVQGRRLTRPMAVAGAVAATLAVWLFAHLAGVELTVRSGAANADHVGPASVAFATLLAGLAAWGLLAALERFTAQPRLAFVRIAIGVLVVSLAGPIGLGVTAAATVTLACMHLTAAAVLIPGLARSPGRRT